jgi:alpha-2-macroglobulin-like protein
MLPAFHVMEHLDDYLHGLLAAKDAEYVEEHCHLCSICDAALHEARKRFAAFETVPVCEASEQLIQQTLGAIQKHDETRKVIRRWTIRGALAGVAAALLILGGFQIYYATMAPSPYELTVLGQKQLLANTAGSVRIRLHDRKTGQPVAGVPVRVELRDKDKRVQELAQFKTDALGTGQPHLQMPDWEDGAYQLCVIADPGWMSGSEELSDTVTLHRSWQLMLTSDKPVYQPGQSIRIRSLSLRRPDLKPVAGETVQFTVTDPKGNLIFKKRDLTSKFGIGSIQCALAQELIEGAYVIGCKVGDTESRLQVEVKKYVLPKFKIDVTLDQRFYQPGQRVRGKLAATYFYGKPVANTLAEIEVQPAGGGKALIELKPTTDADGNSDFEFVLPGLPPSIIHDGVAPLVIETTIKEKDAAGQETGAKMTRRIGTVVATELLKLVAIPEGKTLVRGESNRIYLFITRPDGEPAAKVNLQISGQEGELTTNELGVASFDFKPGAASGNWTIKATDSQGNTGRQSVTWQCGTATHDFVLRTDRAVYTGGDTVNVSVYGNGNGPIFLDFIKDGQTMLTETVALVEGRGAYALTLPAELFGTLELCAYRFDAQGQAIRKSKVVYLHQAKQINIAAKTDLAEYRPGGQANLRLSLTDPDGTPTPGAISLSAVDEAVFSVLDQRPGMEKSFYNVEQQMLKPVYEIYPWSPDAGSGKDAARIELEQALFARTAKTFEPTLKSRSSPHTLADTSYPAKEWKVSKAREKGLDRMKMAWVTFVCLTLAACVVGFCTVYKPWLAVHQMLERMEERDLQRRAERARQEEAGETDKAPRGNDSRTNWPLSFAVMLALLVVLLLSSIQILGTNANSAFNTVGQSIGRGVGGGGGWFQRDMEPVVANAPMTRPQAVPPPVVKSEPPPRTLDMPPPDKQPAEEPAAPARTREYFPETLLWKPEIITDENGQASLPIDLADSITTWRLTASAVSADGRLGAASQPIRVFQDFFVDVNLPVTLTRGDEIAVPVVVTSYLQVPQKVTVELTPADWFELIDRQEGVRQVELKPGEKLAFRIPIKVKKVGFYPLTIDAKGPKMSDAIKRIIEIVPDGQRIERVVNGSLLNPADLTFSLPANAIDGSARLVVKCYPSDFSQLVEGLENIFRMPSGCFEQTSSTTYPNILALDFLRRTNKSVPAVEARARQYIHTGYQRLLSFEVSGGGFDWFGRPPANRTLTAYGLMEFVDMAKVHDVDPKLIERTRAWLLRQRAADGSWAPEGHDIHDGPGARAGDMARYATTAYIAWAVFDGQGFRPESAATKTYLLSKAPQEIADPYVLALVANALQAMEVGGASSYVEALQARVRTSPDGKLAWWEQPAGSRTNFYGAGRSAQVETTSLAVLAILRGGSQLGTARAALSWLAQQKDGNGTWHSTQATVLALKALVAGAGNTHADDKDREIEIALGNAGKRKMTITADQSDVVQLLDISDLLTTGDNRLSLKELTNNGTGFQVTFRYHVPTTAGGERPAPLAIDLQYDRTELNVNETLKVTAKVTNRMAQSAPMVMLDLPIPPGFMLQTEDLERLLEKPGAPAGAKQVRIAKYQLTGRTVLIYLRGLEAGESLELEYHLQATLPARVSVPGGRVYEYYDPAKQAQSPAVQLSVTSRR